MHRILFEIPMPFGLKPLQIAAYGALLALGALVGIGLASIRAKRNGVRPELILDLALVVIISGLLGARLFFFIFDDWAEFSLRAFINFPSGGLSFYGALALGIPAGITFLRFRLKKEPDINLWKVADISIISIALGIAFARIGCYLNGCCFGKECSPSFPLAQTFPADSIPAQHYAAHGATHWPIPIYPTQIISSINVFILFLVLSFLFNRRRFNGMLFCIFCIWYGITRAAIEFLRADNAPNILHTFTVWQLAGFLLAPFGIVLWVILQRRHKHAQAPTKLQLGKEEGKYQ